jgi:hypothetical protein
MKAKALHRRIFRTLFSVALSCAVSAGTAYATPSTIVWIPSVDIQPYKTVHLTYDSYLRAHTTDGSRFPAIVDVGLTGGVLPFQKIQAEVGFDLIDQPGDAGKYPLFLNAKVGTPEDAWFKGSPAFAVGGYNFGTKSGDLRKGDPVATNQNIVYAIAGKTLPVVGRLEAGYFVGNKKALVNFAETDAAGNFESDEHGVLLSWDRTLSEISDKLWAGVDYQGSDSGIGAFSFGVSWAFAKNVSVILGYDIYNEKKSGGENTYTVQLDINFP